MKNSSMCLMVDALENNNYLRLCASLALTVSFSSVCTYARIFSSCVYILSPSNTHTNSLSLCLYIYTYIHTHNNIYVYTAGRYVYIYICTMYTEGERECIHEEAY